MKRLLCLNFIGHVRLEELQRSRDEVLALLADLPAGFRLLSDLTRLESMDVACEAEISLMMEVFGRKGVSAVVRIIPEPQKDIGFNILSAFHYGPAPRPVTCCSLQEAAQVLAF